jgi:hypothetical protein
MKRSKSTGLESWLYTGPDRRHLRIWAWATLLIVNTVLWWAIIATVIKAITLPN